MCFNMDHCEDTQFSEVGYKTVDCTDCGFSREMELCGYCVSSKECYGSTHLINCGNVSDGHMCYDCHACQDCIMCWNLRNKRYHILNTAYTPEEFAEKKAALELGSHIARQKLWKSFLEHVHHDAVHKYANIMNSTSCTGDNIFHSKNCIECFNVLRGEDLLRVTSCDNEARDSIDAGFIWDNAELIYESMSANRYNIQYSFNIWESSDIQYSELCKSCNDLFGCSGLKQSRYCIFNKQYSKEEYELLKKKIIEHMKKTPLSGDTAGSAVEWGQFFPPDIAPFGYNEAFGYDYYPLEKEQALRLGFSWKDADSKKALPQSKELPDHIDDISQDCADGIYVCETCARNYKIIAQEIALLQQLQMPLPRVCLDCRFRERFSLKHEQKLYKRLCSNCNVQIESTFAPERSETVLCEDCYQKTVI